MHPTEISDVTEADLRTYKTINERKFRYIKSLYFFQRKLQIKVVLATKVAREKLKNLHSLFEKEKIVIFFDWYRKIN